MKMNKILSGIISAVCAVSAFGTCISASAEEKTTPSGIAYENIGTEIDNFIEQYKSGLASCEVSVFDGTGVIFNGYYGHADIENGIEADDTTVYDWGSASKILVWTSVMQQYERGNLDLEADIREYLPEGFLTKLQYEDEKITMLNLMNHNAGFQESWYENQLCKENELFDSLEAAVKYCECYQAYHVGEYTAYSNWGTALAAYIVECVSGEDYIEYVHSNIFEPLGMENSSIDPHMNDNAYVKEKRNELKCYCRYADPKYNEDFGTAIAWVQLFPAGSAMSTLEDFSKFGQAFVSENCPLFENESTKELMLSPTSFYGNSDIAENCHGLWTNEYKIQTVGHAGNTYCSSMLQFDPVSGLGVVIMTNESGETMFNYGIPELIYGKFTDRDEFKNAVITDKKDISGLYQPTRTVAKGAGKIVIGGMPWQLKGDGTYSMAFSGIKLSDSLLRQITDNIYVWENNGMNMFIYRTENSDGKIMLQSMSSDYLPVEGGWAPSIAVIALMMFSVGCIIALIIKLIAYASKKNRASLNKQIILQQIMYIIIGLISAESIGMLTSSLFHNHAGMLIICILSGAVGVFSLINGGILCFNTAKSSEMTKFSKAVGYIWSILAVLLTVYVMYFDIYKFWVL